MGEYIDGLVSVVIPTYKRTDKLERALDSVLSQTYKEIELLLVNDNVPDDEYSVALIERVKKYESDQRFHLLLQEKHINGAVARNYAIKRAKGEYIAFLDDDDWWEPTKLEKQVAILSQLDESWGGASCLITQYDAEGNIIGKTRKYREGYIYKDVIFMTTDVATGTLLLRHAALDKAGYFDEALLRYQDVQLLTQFTFNYKLKLVEECLHNADCSDAQNRLVDEEKLVKASQAYFESTSFIINNLSSSEKKCAQIIREVIIGYVLLRNRRYFRGIKYCASLFVSPKACYKVAQIFRRKLKEKKYGQD